MKPLSFQKCLTRAIELLPQRKGIVYVSLGSFVKKNVSDDKLQLQQAPLSILNSGKQSIVILVDPLFLTNDPLYMDRLQEYNVKENGTEIINPKHPKVRFMKCGDFVTDKSNDIKKLTQLILQHPYIEFYIGDFTLTAPCVPFNEYPDFHKKIVCLPNVWLSQSCTKEIFKNGSYLCPMTPSPYIYTPKQFQTNFKTKQKKKITPS